MSIEVRYNGLNPFGTLTPYVDRSFSSSDVNGYISGVERLTISGFRRVPVCSNNFASIRADIETLKSFFVQQFKPIEVFENGNLIFSHPAAKIVAVSVPENSFYNKYPYEITLDCIDDYLNEEILEPVDQWSGQEDENGTFTITHTVSARGIGQNAYEKARGFVLKNSTPYDLYLFLDQGIDQVFLLDDGETPLLLDSHDRRYALISRVTVPNRLTGEFRMTETWVYNPSTDAFGVMTYQISVSENQDETAVEISGEIQVNRVDAYSNEIQNAKTTFDSLDFQAIAQYYYQISGGVGTLSSVRTFQVNETPDLGTVSFTLGWGSNSKNSPYLIEKSTVSINKSGGPNCFTYGGTIKMDGRCGISRAQDIKTYFDSIDWNVKILQKWNKYGTGETLTANWKNKSVSTNNSTGEITISMTYCADFEAECGAVEGFKYTMNWTPSIEQYSPDPILFGKGYYKIQDLGFKNRQGFSISGSARRVKCYNSIAAKGEIKHRLNSIMLNGFPGSNRILLVSDITEDKTGDFYSFNYSWSADAN